MELLARGRRDGSWRRIIYRMKLWDYKGKEIGRMVHDFCKHMSLAEFNEKYDLGIPEHIYKVRRGGGGGNGGEYSPEKYPERGGC